MPPRFITYSDCKNTYAANYLINVKDATNRNIHISQNKDTECLGQISQLADKYLIMALVSCHITCRIPV